MVTNATASSMPSPKEQMNANKRTTLEAPNYNLTSSELSSVAANLIGAGADTFGSTLVTAVIAMREFPEILGPAWEGLDREVSCDQSPGPSDDFPYMRTFVEDVFRWRSVDGVAIVDCTAHAPTRDDTYADITYKPCSIDLNHFPSVNVLAQQQGNILPAQVASIQARSSQLPVAHLARLQCGVVISIFFTPQAMQRALHY